MYMFSISKNGKISLHKNRLGKVGKSKGGKMSALLLTALMILSSLSILALVPPLPNNLHVKSSNISGGEIISNMFQQQRDYVPHAPTPLVPATSTNFTGNVNVFIAFKIKNQSALSSYLSNLSDPGSAQYHHYINKSEFTSLYSQNLSFYGSTASFFSSFNGVKVSSYSDRLGMDISGPSSQIGKILNVTFVSMGKGLYTTGSNPSLPGSIAGNVAQITGLSNKPLQITYNLNILNPSVKSPSITPAVSTFPTPTQVSGAQYIWGSDLQVAYQEQSLLNVTYPTNQVVATLLWSGSNSTGSPTAPFNPSDISGYYNSTLPSYEPHPNVYGVPVNGAPRPGVNAANDTTGAASENALDLEMVGSLAPGSSIYNVYGPNPTNASLDAAFAFILNPNATFSNLDNVSVITNSWGGMDGNNTAWYNYLQEAQARGITVLASSGDSGDNPSSSKYTGSQLEFPSAMAYNSFGITAVGGDTLTLNAALRIASEVAWNNSASRIGSTGGISSAFPEPSWQLNSLANNVIGGQGRGVPDISAIANNTYVEMSVYQNGAGFVPYDFISQGTSVASPVVAGIIAEVDAVLNHYNESNLGYLNPTLYSLGNMQFSPMVRGAVTDYISTGSYNSTLPMLAYYEVSNGSNDAYSTHYGYDLVTGWGSLYAYNFTQYVLNRNFNDRQYALDGVRNSLYVNNLNVTSPASTGNFNASIQQNFYLADQMGAPIYWIQNVIYIQGSQSQGWSVNYTGWVIYPFYGLYPYQSVYEYNFPAGEVVKMPHLFNITSWISNANVPYQQTLNYEVNSHIISLPVPGAAYIIGSYSYNYSWNGSVYSNGPFPGNPSPGGLAPQFGFVGGPSIGVGFFSYPTQGYMLPQVLPMGATQYETPGTATFTNSTTQTGETAHNLLWSQAQNGNWTMSVQNGSTEQGVVSFNNPQYTQAFYESGLPGGTTWYVNVSNGMSFSGTGSEMNLSLVNGTYNATVSTSGPYSSYPGNVTFNVGGMESNYIISFASYFNETILHPVRSYDFLDNTTQSGSYLHFGPTPEAQVGTYSTVLDTTNQYLFTYLNFNDTLVVTNVSTGQIVRMIPFTGITEASIVYDNYTGLVYVLGANVDGILAINASNLQVFGLSQPMPYWPSPSSSTFNYISTANDGKELVVLSYNGTMVVYNASTGNYINVYNQPSPTGFFPQGLYSYMGFAVYTSGNNIVFANLSTGVVNELPVSASYGLQNIFEVGNNGLFVLSGHGGNNNLMFNASNGSVFSLGYTINGQIYYATENPISGQMFLLTYLFPGSFQAIGSLTVVKLKSGTILSSVPAPGLIAQMSFDSASQQLYLGEANAYGVIAYYTEPYYNVTLTERGLPAGSTWYANVTGQQSSGPLTEQSFSQYLPNGNYSYYLGSVNKLYYSSGGSFTVQGSALGVQVQFSKYQYNVDFAFPSDFTSLPSGTDWYVNVTNGPKSGPLSSTSTDFQLNNGTYAYNLGVNNNVYVPQINGKNANSGTFTVKGGAVTVQVGFVFLNYNVTFNVHGLPAGTHWYLNSSLEGTVSAYNNSVVLLLHNGTYTFIASNTSLYYTNGSIITVTVKGDNAAYSITYDEYGFINGSVSPSSSTVMIGGRSIDVVNGNFSAKVIPGSYEVAATDSGYKTYYDNLTATSGHTDTLNISLHPQQIKSPPPSNPMGSSDIVYIAAGAVAAVAIGAGISIGMRRKR